MMARRIDLREMLFVGWQGCSDGNCMVRGRLSGMHTNGGCKCLLNADRAKLQMLNARLGLLLESAFIHVPGLNREEVLSGGVLTPVGHLVRGGGHEPPGDRSTAYQWQFHAGAKEPVVSWEHQEIMPVYGPEIFAPSPLNPSPSQSKDQS